jgi:hypothetical protein
LEAEAFNQAAQCLTGVKRLASKYPQESNQFLRRILLKKSVRRCGEDTLTLQSSRRTLRRSRSRSHDVRQAHVIDVHNVAPVQESTPRNHADMDNVVVPMPKRMPRSNAAVQSELEAECLRREQHDDMCSDEVARMLRNAPDKTLRFKSLFQDEMVCNHLSQAQPGVPEALQLNEAEQLVSSEMYF